ncbi:MAG: TlpA family protein disulfide reductase [Ilumatobacteraceae bacterium]
MKISGKSIAAVVGVVVLGAAAVAIGSGGGSDGGSGNDASLAQYQPVSVSGTPLPAMPDDGSADAAIGQEVPVVKGLDFAGEAVSLDVAAGGRPTIVVFLAHWCPHCNREIPRILEADADGGIPEDVRVVGVATGSRADQPNWPPSAWLETMGWKWERMADSEAADAFMAYGGTSYPTMVFVRADGTVQNRVSGEIGTVALKGLINGLLETVASA